MKLWLFLLIFISGCSSVSTQSVHFLPEPNTCVKVSVHNLTSAATAMPCFGDQGQFIGMVQGTGQSPLDLISGGVNAAIISGGAAVAGALLAR